MGVTLKLHKHGTYLEHYCSGSKMDLTVWIDRVSAEERRGQGQCWCSCCSRVELAGNHEGEAKQMPLRDGAKVAGKAEDLQGM